MFITNGTANYSMMSRGFNSQKKNVLVFQTSDTEFLWVFSAVE